MDPYGPDNVYDGTAANSQISWPTYLMTSLSITSDFNTLSLETGNNWRNAEGYKLQYKVLSDLEGISIASV